MKLLREYRAYVGQLVGAAPEVTNLQREQISGLPLQVRSSYRFARMELFGRSLVLAVQNSLEELARPSTYRAHMAVMRDALGEDVVLVLPRLTSYLRQQLVRMHIPFAVPHVQLFLPPMLVDLRERLPRHIDLRSDTLTPAAQVVVLRYLLGSPTADVPLGRLADELGYSSMAMTNVGKELEALELCTVSRRGRCKVLVFESARRRVWESASRYLRNPAKNSYWVSWEEPPTDGLSAGIAALSKATLVSDEEVPSLAIRDRLLRSHVDAGRLVIVEGPEVAKARVESWLYDPRLLSQGDCVDMLSLYLSIRHMDDERIGSALDGLIEGLDW